MNTSASSTVVHVEQQHQQQQVRDSEPAPKRRRLTKRERQPSNNNTGNQQHQQQGHVQQHEHVVQHPNNSQDQQSRDSCSPLHLLSIRTELEDEREQLGEQQQQLDFARMREQREPAGLHRAREELEEQDRRQRLARAQPDFYSPSGVSFFCCLALIHCNWMLEVWEHESWKLEVGRKFG